MANDGSIRISDGDISINGFMFETMNYEPPSYPRAISISDVPKLAADGRTQTMTRTVDDLGRMLGVWKSFTIHCYNADSFDQPEQAHRGQLLYDQLQEVFSIVGEPLLLKDLISQDEYWVMFDSSGLVVKYAPPTRAAGVDPVTGESLGPEFDVEIVLFEVEAPEDT